MKPFYIAASESPIQFEYKTDKERVFFKRFLVKPAADGFSELNYKVGQLGNQNLAEGQCSQQAKTNKGHRGQRRHDLCTWVRRYYL